MRGEVQIWEGDKLIHKESNLLVNGAGESIADMLTVSPSLSGIPSASALLDTSNYTIQAISFGKDASAYQFNAHALPYRRNLWHNSTPSSDSGNDVFFGNDLIVSSRPDITPPPQYAYVPSSTAHVLSLEDKNDDTNSTLQMYLYSSTHYSDTTTSAGQDEWICASLYVKFPIEFSALVPAQDTDTTFRHPRTHLGMSIYGEGRDLAGDYSRGGLGHSRLGTISNWNDTGTTPEADGSAPSAINFSYANAPEFGTARSEGSGYSINNWQQNGGVVPVGEGWYRLWAAGLAPVSGVSGIATTVYPIGWEDSPYGETQGGCYVYGFQLEVGRWPTDLDFANNRRINNWDLSGSVLNRDHVPGFPTDNGTVRVIPPYGTSSYVPTNYLSSPPNPDSTRVEDGDTALLDLSSDTLRNFNMGQNLNVIPYRKNPGGPFGKGPINGSMELFPHNVSHGSEQITWMKNYESGFFPGPNGELSGLGSFGPQAYYLGCYPEGSSTGGSTFALVSSLDNSAAYLGLADASSSPYYVHGTYNSIVNEASSMDVSGFVGKVYDPQNTVAPVANPNLLSYTVDPGSSPGVTFPNDLDGTYWGADQTKVASYSSVEFTNPFGGPSSMLCSGLSSWPDGGTGLVTASGYGLCIATTNNNRIPVFPAASSTTYIASIFVKRPTNGYETSSCMLNLKDATDPNEAYLAMWEFDGAVPSLKSGDTGITTHQEDYGNGWWRLQVRLKGSDVTEDTKAGDRMNLYFYGGDSANLGGGNYTPSSNWTGKTMYAYGPQMEVYPDAYDMSATPYQAVAAVSPTVAENQGQGGLHVSGGVDTTNSGTVEYSITVGSGDVGYSNLYGGIYNMGLWTIDTESSRLAGNMAPYSFGPLDNPRKYKLFATKHLTKNLGYIEDSNTNPGCLNYSDLTIKWRIHFT